MDDLSNAYRILGLDGPVSKEALKKTYRDLVKTWHPDQFQHDEQQKHAAEQKLREINGAYQILLSKIFAESAGETNEPPPPPPPPESSGGPRPKSKNRAAVWVGSLAVLAVAALVFGVWFSKEPRPYEPPANARVIADHIITFVDDFTVEAFHDGKRVPDAQRKLLGDIYGASAERFDVTVREGDWMVFHVVNNKFRWDGTSCFIAAGLQTNGETAFVSELQTGRWSCCDDLAAVPKFIASPDFMATNRPHLIERAWQDGINRMKGTVKGWDGQAIWGTNSSSWIKFRAPSITSGK